MSEQDDSSNLQEMIETSRSQNELEESYRKNYLANREILASILVSLCSIFPAGAAGFLFVSAISRNSFLDESIFYWAGFNGFLAAISATACWHLLKKNRIASSSGVHFDHISFSLGSTLLQWYIFKHWRRSELCCRISINLFFAHRSSFFCQQRASSANQIRRR